MTAACTVQIDTGLTVRSGSHRSMLIERGCRAPLTAELLDAIGITPPSTVLQDQRTIAFCPASLDEYWQQASGQSPTGEIVSRFGAASTLADLAAHHDRCDILASLDGYITREAAQQTIEQCYTHVGEGRYVPRRNGEPVVLALTATRDAFLLFAGPDFRWGVLRGANLTAPDHVHLAAEHAERHVFNDATQLAAWLSSQKTTLQLIDVRPVTAPSSRDVMLTVGVEPCSTPVARVRGAVTADPDDPAQVTAAWADLSRRQRARITPCWSAPVRPCPDDPGPGTDDNPALMAAVLAHRLPSGLIGPRSARTARPTPGTDLLVQLYQPANPYRTGRR